MTQEETVTTLHDARGDAATVEVHPSFWAAFAHHQLTDPGRTFLIDQDGEYTAERVADLVDVVAGAMAARGVEPGSRVMVRGTSDLSTVVTTLASSRLGAAICPVNVQFGAGEIERLSTVIRPALAVTPTPLDGLDSAPFDELAAAGTRRVARFDEHVGEPTDLALVALTGGTTGVPKAVMHDLVTVTTATSGVADIAGITADDTVMGTIPIGSAPGFAFSIGLALTHGTSLVLRKFDPLPHVLTAERHACAWTMAVPTQVGMMAAAATDAGVVRPLRAMRGMAVGGSPMYPHTMAQWEETLGVPLLRMFGMSECLGHCSMRPEEPAELRHSLDGRPFPGTDDQAFGPDGERLPLGTPGSAGVKGPSLFKGYLGQPDLKASRTTRDGYFLTGDLIQRREDGYVQVVGRESDLIIRGGTNIDPHEIEDLLLTLPEVAEALVVGYPDDILGERVHAVLAAATGAEELTVDQMAELFRARGISSFKCPDKVTYLPEFPRTAMGKLDVRAVKTLITEGE